MIATMRKPGPTFSADMMIKNGGAAILTDSDPNAVAPPASRILNGAKPGFWFTGTGQSGNFVGPFLTLMSGDGTSIAPRCWWYDDSKSLWLAIAAAATLTTAANNFVQLRFSLGAKLFVQVTANTGVTKLAVILR